MCKISAVTIHTSHNTSICKEPNCLVLNQGYITPIEFLKCYELFTLSIKFVRITTALKQTTTTCVGERAANQFATPVTNSRFSSTFHTVSLPTSQLNLNMKARQCQRQNKIQMISCTEPAMFRISFYPSTFNTLRLAHIWSVE